MHEIEQYGGRRIKPGSPVILVEFDTEANMNRWLRCMRQAYTQNQFAPCVNRETFIVAY